MDPPRSPGSHFGCNLCGAIFGRAEHLSRHRLSHTNTKPFTCLVCSKGFTRSDTLQRHLPIHSTPTGKGRSGRAIAISRVSKACDNCARLRLRCDGQTTCFRCQFKRVKCVYSAQTRRRVEVVQDALVIKTPDSISVDDTTGVPETSSSSFAPGSSSCAPLALSASVASISMVDAVSLTPLHMSLTSATIPAIISTTLGKSHDVDNRVMQAPPPPPKQPLPYHHLLQEEHGQMQSSIVSPRSSTSIRSSSLLSYDHTQFSTGEHTLHASAEAAYNMPTSSIFTDHLLHCGTPSYDDLGLDWAWNEAPGLAEWMNFSSGSEDNIFPIAGQSSTEGDFDAIRYNQSMSDYPDGGHYYGSRGSLVPPNTSSLQDNEATCASNPSNTQDAGFKSHQWPTDWNPVGSDNLVAFPDMSSASSDIVEAENFAHVEPLSQSTYDDILQYMRRTDTYHAHYRSLQNTTNFPPIHVMDCFLQLYFEYFHPIFPMLHQATFELSCKIPWQLFLAVCAIGAQYSKLPSASQCSNALQELLRRAIAGTIETDNSFVRQLWLTQIMILNSIGMMYSGNKRFFEIAEAVRSSPAVQCHRNASIKGPSISILVHDTCSGRSLERIWKQWIHEEGRIRLGFSAFLMDAQVVLYLDANPCLTASELQLQLPCSESIWNAPTAEAWKEEYLKHASMEVPTVELAMKQLQQEKRLSSAVGDFARLVLVFITYIDTAAVTKLRDSLLILDQQRVDKVVDEGHRTALTTLEVLRSDAQHDNGFLPLRSSLTCHINLSLMLLFTPRAEVVSHAHSFNTELKLDFKAVGVYERLHQWMDRDAGRYARRAIAAAGALTGLLHSNSTLGFYEPIAAVLATLTLWTYSYMAEQQSLSSYVSVGMTSERMSNGGRASMVRLDNFHESRKVREWIDGSEVVRAHIKGVGNICRPSAGSRILDVGRDMVAGRCAWLLSQGFSVWLSKLRARAEDYDSMVG